MYLSSGQKMRIVMFILILTLIQLTGVCQNTNEFLRISKDLELIKISGNAYIHVSYAEVPRYGRVAANGLIFINKHKAFLFDTPWTDSLTEALVSYMKDKMGLELSGFIPNHWHADCMGGLGYLQSHKIPSYANQKTIDIARSKNLPVPDHSFKDSIRLYLDDKVLNCYFLGAAHSLDNVVVWIPSEKILFPGCMVKSLNSTDLGNIADGDINAYPGTIDKVIEKFSNARVVIPGHGQYGGLDLLKHTRDLIRKLPKQKKH
jgi:metallo-beta-lactamase class B